MKGGIDFLKMKLNLEKTTQPELKYNYGLLYNIKQSIFEVLPNDSNEIIFLGNSLIDYCDWNELFQKSNIKNRGIEGDFVIGVIDRLNEIVESRPKKIFLMIGTNDLGHNRTITQILSDYERLIKLIKEKTPETELYIQSILPTYNDPKRKNRDIIEINKSLLRLSAEYSATYINLFDILKTSNGKLNPDYSFDGLHLNGQGYLLWKNELEKYIDN
jgi:lysophospholipase L1-like esterase